MKQGKKEDGVDLLTWLTGESPVSCVASRPGKAKVVRKTLTGKKCKEIEQQKYC